MLRANQLGGAVSRWITGCDPRRPVLLRVWFPRCHVLTRCIREQSVSRRLCTGSPCQPAWILLSSPVFIFPPPTVDFGFPPQCRSLPYLVSATSPFSFTWCFESAQQPHRSLWGGGLETPTCPPPCFRLFYVCAHCAHQPMDCVGLFLQLPGLTRLHPFFPWRKHESAKQLHRLLWGSGLVFLS